VQKTNEPVSDKHLPHDAAILETWRKLCSCFSGVKYVGGNPKDFWTLTTRPYVADVTHQWKLSYWKKARVLLVPLEDSEIDYLRVLAQQRLETSAANFRAWAVSSVSIPVSALVVANQLFPEWIRAEVFNNDSGNSLSQDSILGLGILLFINLLYIFMNVFKAREMRSALEMIAAERRLKRGETIASAGGDAAELSL